MLSLPENFSNGFVIGDEYKYVALAYFCFWFSVLIAFLTFPLAFYAYCIILQNDAFRNSYVYKLIVFNGVANCIQYTTWMLAIQMGVMPNLHEYFAFLKDYNLVHLNIFLALFSCSMQASSSMLIALNRLLSILKAIQLRNDDNSFAKTVCIFSIGLPFLLTFPVFISYCYYDPVRSPMGETHYIAVVVHMFLMAPWGAYTTIMGMSSNFLSCALAFQLMKIRRRQNKSVVHSTSKSGIVSKAEQGLILSVVFSSCVQLMNLVFGLLCSIWQVTIVAVFLSAVMAIYTAAPFWSLMIFVPSVRNCAIPSSVRRRMSIFRSSSVAQSTLSGSMSQI